MSKIADEQFSPPSATGSPCVRVLCVDDHPLVCKGIAAILEASPEVELIGEAHTGAAAVEAYRRLRPEVVLMDLRLPDMSGIDATEEILAEFPEARIIVLTSYDGDQDVYRALESGVRGYLLKEIVHTDLIKAILAVRSGKRFVPLQVTQHLIDYFPEVALTSRETEVLVQVAHGLGNKEIGFLLGTSAGTVKTHVQSIIAKLGARDRTQAVTIGLRRGIIHLGSGVSAASQSMLVH
jgi:DNA-binding NarL/FixJ family response regulator